MTALTIVIADTPYYNEQREIVATAATPDGVVVTSRAFETFLPQFPVILAIAVALFAFSTLITWSYYTMKAWTRSSAAPRAARTSSRSSSASSP